MPLFRREKVEPVVVELQPAYSVMAPGDRVKVAVKVAGAGEDVTLSASSAEGEGPPEGIKVDFSPPAGPLPLTSVMEASVSREMKPGAYPFLVVATTPKRKIPATFVVIVQK
ncbi:MAG: hypothetical protein ACK4GQ_02350 [Candidatus Hadarchaeales archaeon]